MPRPVVTTFSNFSGIGAHDAPARGCNIYQGLPAAPRQSGESGAQPTIREQWIHGGVMSTKSPNPIDVHVGSRIRSRRMALKISQEKLADGLGLTFQQVQKYEKGTNRVGASRLQMIAAILTVPVSFFFEDAPSQPAVTRKKAAHDSSIDFVTDFLGEEDGHRLIKAFLRIRAPVVRRSIVHMVEAISAPRSS
jgi:transcriptional regulator with XRE-family HTH domain